MEGYRDEQEVGELFPAEVFTVNIIFCPGCRKALREPVETCPACGYSGKSAVKKFPFEAPAFERFIDPNDHLGVEECQKIDRALDDLANDFPQPRFCFCVVDLAAETDPREFGFWLMNASPVRSAVEERLRPWSVLLLIDHAHARASVTPGYAIEPFIDEGSWTSLLQLESRYFSAGDYGSAILRFVKGAEVVLSEAAERAQSKMGKGRKKKRGAEW